MALETATYIDGLDSSNPAGSDAISTADDHLRLIKSTIKATFPNITGAVTTTQAQINDVVNKAPIASPTFTGTPAAPTAAAGTSTTQLATTAFVTTAVTNATGSLGTMSSQNSNNVTITGGSVTGVAGSTAATGTSNTNLATNAYVGQEIAAIPYASQNTKGLVRAYVSGTSLYLFTVN